MWAGMAGSPQRAPVQQTDWRPELAICERGWAGTRQPDILALPRVDSGAFFCRPRLACASKVPSRKLASVIQEFPQFVRMRPTPLKRYPSIPRRPAPIVACAPLRGRANGLRDLPE
jgi:hypothetical protein